MLDKIKQLSAEIAGFQAKSLEEVEQFRIKHLSKKGTIAALFDDFKTVPADQKKAMGQELNELKNTALAKINELKELLSNAEEDLSGIDLTMPGDPLKLGTRHPLAIVKNEILAIFNKLGFTISEGPEIEDDWHNFSALNFPEEHPARDMQDSFYITDEILMRTHTSPVQARTMEKHKGQGPVKIICPGKVYRRDNDDATHSHQFQQIEGLVIDENISMSDLKGTLDVFAKKVFGQDREIRLRPSFFPFTEPSVEVDISCKICGGKGCSVCKQTGWIEVLGGGIVHPNVLEMAGFDSKKYSGFAFGIGVERIAMLKYGVDDIRHFYTNDVRFLKQFNHHEA